jgi:hypothetical protein
LDGWQLVIKDLFDRCAATMAINGSRAVTLSHLACWLNIRERIASSVDSCDSDST